MYFLQKYVYSDVPLAIIHKKKTSIYYAETEFKINRKDVLKYTPETETYDVIANIPYYITSPILRHFLYNFR